MEYQSIREMKQLMHRCEPFNSVPVKRNDHSDSEAPPVVRSTRKKPYKPPVVTEYGNVARLTAGVNGSDFDPGHETRARRGG